MTGLLLLASTRRRPTMAAETLDAAADAAGPLAT